MLCEQVAASMLLRDRHPAARLAGNLSLSRFHIPSFACCLARRAIVLLELAYSPAKGRSLPASAANRAGRDAGILERLVGLLSAL
jgi:hypothetical protein